MKKILAFILILSLFTTTACTLNQEDKVGQVEGHSHSHQHGDLPYEWSAEYSLEQGEYKLKFSESNDSSCMIAFVKNGENRDSVEHLAQHVMEATGIADIMPDTNFIVEPDYAYNLILNPEGTEFTFEIKTANEYLTFTEHIALEFDMQIIDKNGNIVPAQNVLDYEGADRH